ncbi:MAG: T9SS type A sorting domain-containing protein, partial [Candidatus Kapaibacterium sp.]
TYTLQNPSLLHLHIFDELGKDIMSLYDGIATEVKHDFSFKLPQGMYYVRMETAEGVMTKKVIVE